MGYRIFVPGKTIPEKKRISSGAFNPSFLQFSISLQPPPPTTQPSLWQNFFLAGRKNRPKSGEEEGRRQCICGKEGRRREAPQMPGKLPISLKLEREGEFWGGGKGEVGNWGWRGGVLFLSHFLAGNEDCVPRRGRGVSYNCMGEVEQGCQLPKKQENSFLSNCFFPRRETFRF